MRIYEVTDTGHKAIKYIDDGSDEMRILNHIDTRGQASEDELEVVATRGQLRSLRNSKLIRVVTG